MHYIKVEITILVIRYGCNKVIVFNKLSQGLEYMRTLNKFWIISLLSLLVVQTSFAQSGDSMEGLVEDTKSDLLVVVGGGLAGAVLGLSTLSFVDEPKDHTRNILVGASIGVIAGVAYVAFNQANKSRDAIYGTPEEAMIQDTQSFNTSRRLSWHQDHINSEPTSSQSTPYQINFSFNY